ncbi:hypothetical protein SCHPADRAFT_346911 [Schizopora paradoxa]|uniref:F-box domain-containing protein n=1 Tax=Schizopora paradoxa TaxID=27342 RepID=A0A0H2RQ88_9AGAM|nr:hypothetical protein SCHPADRAFT_346911 [Schizopora paradoxa]
MQFLNLPEDVLVLCFSFCDVGDLLRLESVSKRVKELICSRRVWMPRLLRFDAEDAQRMAPYVDLNTLSVSDLKYLVVSAHRSQEAWTRPGVTSISPTRYQEVDLYCDYKGPFMHQILQDNDLDEILLLMFGGRHSRRPVDVKPVSLSFGNRHEYLVVRRLPYYIQVAEISSGKCVWQSSNLDVPIIAFDVDSTCVDVGGGEVFRLLTLSLTQEDGQSICAIKIISFLSKPGGGIQVDDSSTVKRKFRLGESASYAALFHTKARLEGDFIVVSDILRIWLIKWKLGRCVRVAWIIELGEPLQIAGQHLAFLTMAREAADIAGPEPWQDTLTLTVIPLREAFDSHALSFVPEGEDRVMNELVLGVAQLPAQLFKMTLPKLRYTASTVSYRNEAWFRRKDQGQSKSRIEDITFFVMCEFSSGEDLDSEEDSEDDSEHRTLMLFQAKAESELSTSGGDVASPETFSTTSRSQARVLPMSQVGKALQVEWPTANSNSSCSYMSQSGRFIFFGEDDITYALSKRDFITGSNEPPVLELEGCSTRDKLISMNPNTGAICYLKEDGNTIRISYFGD